MTLTAALAASAIAFGAAATQGSVGIGYSLLAAPLLALMDTRFVPGPVLCGLVILGLLMALDERHDVDRGGLRWALAGRVPGTVIGIGALALLARDQLALLVGGGIIVGAGLSATRLRPRRSRGTFAAAGLVSGAMETTSSVGGPPLALIYRGAPEGVVRATMAVFFVVGGTLSLVALAMSGNFGLADLVRGGVIAPGTAAGFLAVRASRSRMTPALAERAVLILSACAGAGVLVKAVV